MNRNKLVFISGATSGIGKATASLLASKAYNLIINGRRKELLYEMEAELSRDFGIRCKSLPFDVRNFSELEKAVNSLEGDWKNIDILINNAGLAAGLERAHEASLDDWDQMIDTNVKGLLYLTRLISPRMVERRSGHIINITSIAGKEVYAKASVYCASKHAADAFTKGLRIDLVPYNIKVTSIAPGAVETEFSLVRFKGDKTKASQVYNGFDPLLGPDIAEAVLFAITRPEHVNINDMLIMPTAQANAVTIDRK